MKKRREFCFDCKWNCKQFSIRIIVHHSSTVWNVKDIPISIFIQINKKKNRRATMHRCFLGRSAVTTEIPFVIQSIPQAYAWFSSVEITKFPKWGNIFGSVVFVTANNQMKIEQNETRVHCQYVWEVSSSDIYSFLYEFCAFRSWNDTLQIRFGSSAKILLVFNINVSFAKRNIQSMPTIRYGIHNPQSTLHAIHYTLNKNSRYSVYDVQNTNTHTHSCICLSCGYDYTKTV